MAERKTPEQQIEALEKKMEQLKAQKKASELPIVLSQWASCFVDLVTYYLHRR